MLIAGIILLTFSSDKSEKTVSVETSTAPINTAVTSSLTLEEKLRNILMKAEGVGDTEVFVNYCNSQYNSEIKTNSSKSSITFEKEDKNADYVSEIEGVIIVAEGGGDVKVSSMLRNSVSEILGIPLHKVIVLKMNETE